MGFIKKLLLGVLILGAIGTALFFVLAERPVPSPEDITYGVTFSKFRTDELGIPWKETYDALLDELGVTHLRLVAHWPMIEPENGTFNFSEMDYQMRRAEEEGAEVILAVGLRLPSWPECHLPEWAKNISEEERNKEFFAYLKAVVERYKDSSALKWWQVENEPFIIGFALEQCGVTNERLLESEIAFVRSLDPNHPILLTASGELGLWNDTWKRGDVFGTTLYRWVYSGEFKSYIQYPTSPAFFRAKRTVTELMTGQKNTPAIIAELAAEPWVKGATKDAPLEEQLSAMNVSRLESTVTFAAKTSFDEQYFWGAEWWYYLKKVHGNTEIWDWAKEFFKAR